MPLSDLHILNVSRNAIVDIPEGFGKFQNLKSIDLSKNAVAHLPADLKDLNESGSLNLTDNPYAFMPELKRWNAAKQNIIRGGGTHKITDKTGDSLVDWLTFLTDPINLDPGLPDLTVSTDLMVFEDITIIVSFDKDRASLRSLKFDLAGFDDYTEIFRGTDTHTVTTTSVEGESLNPHHLRKWIFNLFLHTELEELQVSFLNTELPDLFAAFTKLKCIDFSGSRLTKLPPSFCKLRALEILKLDYTPLSELPDNFNRLTNLVSLYLNKTSITKLPDRLDTLTNLKTIALDSSKLTQLPPGFAQLKALENLYLGKTAIAELPDSFGTLTNLKTINLSGSKLIQLPPCFAQLQTLEVLYLEDTAITDLSNRFNALSNLQKISLKGSKLKQLPPGFFQLPALEWLDLRDSSLPEIPAELGQLQTLKYLAFSQPCAPAAWIGLTELTELQCYCPNFHVPSEFSQLIKLKTLHLKSVSSAKRDAMNLPELEKLEFKVSNSASPFSLQSNMPSLKELTTDYLTAFATGIANCKSLEKIVAYGKTEEAGLKPLKESLRHLNKLTCLDLKGMGITDMGICTSAVNLEYLDLSGNAIVDIPVSLANLQKLKTLLLNKNPLTDFPELPVMPALAKIEFANNQMPEDEESPAVHPDSKILARMAGNFPNAFLAYELF
ncbi:MAG: leucine-rich repeat domain-containing protein [Cyclobacteriaceae bacterium]|nr:leucine-rich repeat domain-containing protein [Cyclobacteriaceae bacterium]